MLFLPGDPRGEKEKAERAEILARAHEAFIEIDANSDGKLSRQEVA